MMSNNNERLIDNGNEKLEKRVIDILINDDSEYCKYALYKIWH